MVSEVQKGEDLVLVANSVGSRASGIVPAAERSAQHPLAAELLFYVILRTTNDIVFLGHSQTYFSPTRHLYGCLYSEIVPECLPGARTFHRPLHRTRHPI